MTLPDVRPWLEVSYARGRDVRSWAIGPGARWACPVIGGLLAAGGLLGFLALGGGR